MDEELLLLLLDVVVDVCEDDVDGGGDHVELGGSEVDEGAACVVGAASLKSQSP